MARPKKLNETQAKCLIIDIIQQDVKRLGLYKIGKYNVAVTEPTKKKLKKKNSISKYQKQYREKKAKGICVNCSRKATPGYVMCKKCRDNHNRRQNNRR